MRSGRSGYDRISDNEISDVSDEERSLSPTDVDSTTDRGGQPFHRRAWRAVNGPAVLDDVQQTQASLVKIFHDLSENAGSYVYSDGYAPTFKLACFFCGVVMTIFGVIGFLAAGGLMNKMINMYEVAVGLLMLMLEGRKKFVVSFDAKLIVFEQFHLITTLSGKGALYVLAGILFTSAKPFTNFIVGLYAITVGVLCIFYAVKGRGRLKKFKENHPMTLSSQEEIRIKFAYFDSDHDDCLTFEEFIHFLYDAGVFLSHNEAEATAARFDLFNYERRIHVEEFMALYEDEPYIHLTETLLTLKSNSNEAPHLVLEKETLKKKNSAKVEMEKAEALRTSLHAALEEEEANKLAAQKAIRDSEETQLRLKAEAAAAEAEAKRLKGVHDDAHAAAETLRSAPNERLNGRPQEGSGIVDVEGTVGVKTAEKTEASDNLKASGTGNGGGASTAVASATTASNPAP